VEDTVVVNYCPTEMMVADFYIKPLQGKMFRVFRNRILNLPDDPCLDAATQHFLECLNPLMILGKWG